MEADADTFNGLLAQATAGRRILLVLDDAASAAQVRCVFPGPDTRVLVTSRHPPHGLPDTGSAQLHLPAPMAAPAPPPGDVRVS